MHLRGRPLGNDAILTTAKFLPSYMLSTPTDSPEPTQSTLFTVYTD